MGNRGGCLHSPDGRIVRSHRSRAWLVCLLEFRGRRRSVMAPGLYTELFFLDEATALAAGHRPCFECRRGDALAFAQALTGRDPGEAVRAGEVDDALHPHRLPLGRDRHTWTARAANLPDGTFVRLDGGDAVLAGGALRRWSFDGYGPGAAAPSGPLAVLTPEPTVRALADGYPVALHPSARPRTSEPARPPTASPA